jgi:hypothetical protein
VGAIRCSRSAPDSTRAAGFQGADARGDRIGPRSHTRDALQQPMDSDDARGLWEAWLAECALTPPDGGLLPGWKHGASAELGGFRALDGRAR